MHLGLSFISMQKIPDEGKKYISRIRNYGKEYIKLHFNKSI